MPIRHFADVNQTSDSYGGGTNASMNRHEEFRLEKNREFNQAPQKTGWALVQESASEYKRKNAIALGQQQLHATSISKNSVNLGNRTYLLPPVEKQQITRIIDARGIDAHLGGLGFKQHMYDLLYEVSSTAQDYNKLVDRYNTVAEKKAKGSLFKKKQAGFKKMEFILNSEITARFNHKLAENRVPVFLSTHQGHFYVEHPSSQSGNPQGEIESWSKKHWHGIPERSWSNHIIDFPVVPQLS